MNEAISLDEMIQIQIALEAIIIDCDKLVSSCKHLGIDGKHWADKKTIVSSALNKIETKYNKGEI